ncbi:hypothetical protein BGX38DRAFT_1207454 [Terfezia claveryi]|nr:hypothetical protein BGX38DRAFT_1207454 [Terfezia claveryi]
MVLLQVRKAPLTLPASTFSFWLPYPSTAPPHVKYTCAFTPSVLVMSLLTQPNSGSYTSALVCTSSFFSLKLAMLFHGESTTQFRLRQQARLPHTPTGLHTLRTPAHNTLLQPGQGVSKYETARLVPGEAGRCLNTGEIDATQAVKIEKPICTETTASTTAVPLTGTTLNTVEPPPSIQLPPLSLLSPERLQDLSCLASEMDLSAYSTTSAAYFRWLRKYPEILSEESRLTRHLDIRVPSSTSSNSAEACAKMFIKAMPSPYHDAIGQNMSAQTVLSVQRAVGCSPQSIGLRVGASEFKGFGGPVYDGRLSRVATKTPDLALLPKEKRFPTVATEVGFTETWQHLLEDAQLWLYGTYGNTMSVLLFVLHEGARVKHYIVGTSGSIISKSKATKHKWDWPFYQPQENTSSASNNQDGIPLKIALADPSSALIRILNPKNATPAICNAAEALLADHYLSTNSSGSLIPPLVEPIDATVYLFRRRLEPEVEPEPDWVDPSPDGYFKQSLSCHFRLKFMENDTALAGIQPLVIQLNEILGTIDQDESKAITYDLKELAVAMLQERSRMEERRALDRAHAAVKVLLDQQKGSANKRPLETLVNANVHSPANSFKYTKSNV